MEEDRKILHNRLLKRRILQKVRRDRTKGTEGEQPLAKKRNWICGWNKVIHITVPVTVPVKVEEYLGREVMD